MFPPVTALPRLGWSAKLTSVFILWTLLLGAVFGYVTQTVMSQLRQTHQLVADLQKQVAGSPSGTELAVAGANTQIKSLSSLRGAGDEVPHLPQAPHHRRLGYAIWGNVKFNGEALDSDTGCVYVTGTSTIDLSTKGCGTNSHRCPFCFICAQGNSAIDLRINNCGGAYLTASKQISTSSAKMMIEITVINTGDQNCVVKGDDGATVDSITQKKSTTFFCLSTQLKDDLGATTDKMYANNDR